MIARQRWVKAVLWLIVGFLAVVTVARFRSGLGSTTNLSDAAPWGLWIAFDVMAGVALAAGGFVLAATVHIFHLERYHRFVRPAILTALLGYAAVAVGLTNDLGMPWHMWNFFVHPQHHSVLFEVGMCVMLYLTVLFLEFSPVILEHPLLSKPIFKTIRNVLTRFTIPLVITGIVLSTLHQSSLGSLFLIAPYRLHELWYSPIIWILFFVSAIGLGLMTVTLESCFSAWFFGHRLRMSLLAGLGRAAIVVLTLYFVLRVGDLAVRGSLGAAFDGSFEGFIFLLELALSAVIPVILLSVPRIRSHPWGMGSAAVLSVLGIVGYRFDTCLVGFARPEGASYFPSWMELTVTLGIVAGATLIFIFFVENLRVYEEEEEDDGREDALGEEGEPARPRVPSAAFSPQSFALILPESLAGPRRYSLAALIGASLAMAFLPAEALYGSRPLPTPVSPPRAVEVIVQERGNPFGHEYLIADANASEDSGAVRRSLMVLDGNRDGRIVLFDHAMHGEELGGDASCVLCHHQNLPFEVRSECHSCHRDMYSVTDTFDHVSHVLHLEEDEGCVRCHEDPSAAKTRETALACRECHADMTVEGSRVAPPEEGLTGFAVGYMTAMHELCIRCHEEKIAEEPEAYPAEFAECLNCHRDAEGADLRKLGPYVVNGAEEE